jgi:hypothetical protein
MWLGATKQYLHNTWTYYDGLHILRLAGSLGNLNFLGKDVAGSHQAVPAQHLDLL